MWYVAFLEVELGPSTTFRPEFRVLLLVPVVTVHQGQRK